MFSCGVYIHVLSFKNKTRIYYLLINGIRTSLMCWLRLKRSGKFQISVYFFELQVVKSWLVSQLVFNSSVLCVCPQVNIIEGLELLLMSPASTFWLNLHAPLPSARLLFCLLYLLLQLLSPPSPTLPLPTPSRPFTQCIIWRGEAVERFGGIKVIYEWSNLPGCWRGKPIAVQLSDSAAHCSSSLTAGETLLPFLPLILHRPLLVAHFTNKWLSNFHNTYVLLVCCCVWGAICAYCPFHKDVVQTPIHSARYSRHNLM